MSEILTLDIAEILKILPHRYPFLFIDYIAAIDDSFVTAVKNVSVNDNFFRQIGTDSPMMPESLLCEISAQAGAACVLSRPENAGKLGFFMSIEKAEFFGRVQPGDQMVIDIALPPGKSRFGKGTGTIAVDGKIIADIALMFAIVDA